MLPISRRKRTQKRRAAVGEQRGQPRAPCGPKRRSTKWRRHPPRVVVRLRRDPRSLDTGACHTFERSRESSVPPGHTINSLGPGPRALLTGVAQLEAWTRLRPPLTPYGNPKPAEASCRPTTAETTRRRPTSLLSRGEGRRTAPTHVGNPRTELIDGLWALVAWAHGRGQPTNAKNGRPTRLPLTQPASHAHPQESVG